MLHHIDDGFSTQRASKKDKSKEIKSANFRGLHEGNFRQVIFSPFFPLSFLLKILNPVPRRDKKYIIVATKFFSGHLRTGCALE